MVRLIISVLAIGVGTAVFSFLTVFNGYCGDSVSASQESSCHFHAGGQVAMLLVWYAIVASLVIYAVRGLPRLSFSRAFVGGLLAVASIAVTWYLVVHAENLSLAYWHNGGGGTPTHPWQGLVWLAAIITAFTPPGAFLVAGASLRAARVAAYSAALSSASWLLALAWFTYYYAQHV